MPEVHFIDAAGSERIINASAGLTLMEAARMNDVPGINADCGGVCACATCHVYLEDRFLAAAGPRTECEEPMLEFVENPQPNSRLACQITLTDALDGLVVTTPASQK